MGSCRPKRKRMASALEAAKEQFKRKKSRNTSNLNPLEQPQLTLSLPVVEVGFHELHYRCNFSDPKFNHSLVENTIPRARWTVLKLRIPLSKNVGQVLQLQSVAINYLML